MKLFSQRDAEAYVKTGAKEFRFNREIRLTPAGRDILTEAGIKVIFESGDNHPTSLISQSSSPGNLSDNERLFRSKEAEEIKLQICDIGRRLWQREYVDGNGGNISCRIGPNQVLCTPTLVSKGFLNPDMICMVDLEGNQLAGSHKRTSEITTHLAIYKGAPQAKAVVHAHPVHATAFAIVGYEPPQRLIPEIEVFVGRVPLAPYKTPGSKEMAETIQPMAAMHQSILMGNHGVICWGSSVEDAYFKMEITDAYCRTLVIASHVPNFGTSIPCDKMGELLDIKKKLGLPDPRLGLKPAELCEVDPWESFHGNKKESCSCSCPGESKGPEISSDSDVERLVQTLTDEIMSKLSKGN